MSISIESTTGDESNSFYKRLNIIIRILFLLEQSVTAVRFRMLVLFADKIGRRSYNNMINPSWKYDWL